MPHRNRRIHAAWAALLLAGTNGSFVHAQSRATTLSVSAIVVPRCSIAATWPSVSLRCSGHAAQTARTSVLGRSGEPRMRVGDPNRLDAAWSGVEAADALLVIEF